MYVNSNYKRINVRGHVPLLQNRSTVQKEA